MPPGRLLLVQKLEKHFVVVFFSWPEIKSKEGHFQVAFFLSRPPGWKKKLRPSGEFLLAQKLEEKKGEGCHQERLCFTKKNQKMEKKKGRFQCGFRTRKWVMIRVGLFRAGRFLLSQKSKEKKGTPR